MRGTLHWNCAHWTPRNTGWITRALKCFGRNNEMSNTQRSLSDQYKTPNDGSTDVSEKPSGANVSEMNPGVTDSNREEVQPSDTPKILQQLAKINGNVEKIFGRLNSRDSQDAQDARKFETQLKESRAQSDTLKSDRDKLRN